MDPLNLNTQENERSIDNKRKMIFIFISPQKKNYFSLSIIFLSIKKEKKKTAINVVTNDSTNITIHNKLQM